MNYSDTKIVLIFFKLPSSNGSSPTSITTSLKGMSSVPSHTPMSERQQLALIKKLEKEEALEAAAATLASASSSLISPSTSAPNSNHKLTPGLGNGRTMF